MTKQGEIRPGYKQTEVGVIPVDWDVSTIGKQMKLINGRAFKPSEWAKNGLPIIRIQNLNDPSAEFNYCDDPVEDKNFVRRGDLLFAWSGTLGTSFGARRWSGPDGVLNQHIFKVESNLGVISSDFALLVLGQVQSAIEKQSHGFKASFVHVKKSDLVGVELSFPTSLLEQEAIAQALADADALIAALVGMIAKKRDLKQAAMQHLLTGKTRLPGFSGEWEVKRLGDLGDCIRGVSYKGDTDLSAYETASTVRLFRSNNVQSSRIAFEDLQFVHHSRVSDAQLMRDGDLLVCAANGSKALVGKAAIYRDQENQRYTFGAFMIVFRPLPDKGDPRFVSWLFQSDSYRNQLSVVLAGSSINNLTPTSVKSLSFSVPVLTSEQTAIAEALSDMDADLAALEAQAAKARAVKQGMMQELLTGRVRLV